MASRGDIDFQKVQPILHKKWDTIPFEVSLEKTPKYIKHKTKGLALSGTFPVVDQGEDLISGYIEDAEKIYQGKLPIVIFGDHTRIIKYVDFQFAVGADGTKILKPNENFNSKFFFHYLKALSIPDLGYSRHYKILKEVKIPLPPRPEQDRIVAKVDTLMAQVATMQKSLEHIPQLLKDFRQQVLTQAVTGKLTEEWREGKQLNDWKVEFAKDCCEKVQSGGTPRGSNFAESGIPFFKVYNIVNQQISFDYKPQFISEEIQNSQCKKSICFPNDVLMNIVGPPLNKVAIVPEEFPECNINQAITLFRVKECLNNKFLYYFLCEGSSVNKLVNETRGVVGQVNISLTQCRSFEIPIPPIEEQEEIVRRVESLFTKADAIEQQYQSLKTKIDTLPQAILHKAFKGELVAQLDSDGDAVNLLKEIEELKKNKGRK
ncbi:MULTISPECIES: restriction endonuclease subunit S [Arenibacter]|uniref:restriction endonuclease subunit S n=1 Tax=Arenibacter TaxID=178469 RepID=UPI00068AEF51|nr:MULTISPECIES: restriction endonuclease subunit S [Arenibacter]GBF18024.1 type-1 restriction enzyme EcoKI specificity protein [Arenibacter sp. NBRC 103722]